MKSKKSPWRLGEIILDVILWVDCAVDICTGKLNGTDLAWRLIITLLLSIPLVMLMRRYRKRILYGSAKKDSGEQDREQDR